MSAHTDTEPIIARVALGPQWPTIDPFLFCAHHDDKYPSGDGSLAIAAPLDGRQIGSDFSAKDGWSMYHGSTIPGFPQHPHRGFETISFVRSGLIDHSDSLGAKARFGSGDAQWMTAGSGIVHSEMFPLLQTEAGNPSEFFQVWLNLPASDKLVDPYFTMFWADDIPVVNLDGGGTVTVVAGSVGDVTPPAPPPNSWASRTDSDVAILHIVLPANARWSLPVVTPDTNRVLYAFTGGDVMIAGERFDVGTGVQLAGDAAVEVVAGDEGSECLLLQGRPIGEPVEQQGPFVMNTRAEIEQAFDDYRRTEFGGWPWPSDNPVHGSDVGRFALHADGRREEPPNSRLAEGPERPGAQRREREMGERGRG